MITNHLEKYIEREVCDYAETLGILHRKLSSPAHRSVPDRLFAPSQKPIFLVEFKRAGEVPTILQEREHVRLRVQGVNVFVIDNIQDGYALMDRMK
jgi:hypothetical protein